MTGWRLASCERCRSLRQAQGRLFDSALRAALRMKLIGGKISGVSCLGVAVELGEKIVLGPGDGFGVACGDLGGCFGLAGGLMRFTDGAFGFFGKEVAVGLGLGVAFCYGGGDAGVSCAWCGGGLRLSRGGAGAAGAMGGDAL